MKAPVIKHYGTINNGVLHFYNFNLFQDWINSLGEGEFELVVKRRYKKPSEDQFGYYYGGIIVATCMKFEIFRGWTKEEIHKHFADTFLTYQKMLVKEDGTKQMKNFTLSLADLDKKEMAEFIEKVLNWLAMEGIYPEPAENYHDSIYRTIKK